MLPNSDLFRIGYVGGSNGSAFAYLFSIGTLYFDRGLLRVGGLASGLILGSAGSIIEVAWPTVQTSDISESKVRIDEIDSLGHRCFVLWGSGEDCGRVVDERGTELKQSLELTSLGDLELLADPSS